jgi:DNA-binding IscR family transcriptional regulator
MSERAIAEVWATSEHRSVTLLVHLALAYLARSDGTAIAPVEVIARRARINPRSAARALSALNKAGDLVITPGPGRGLRTYRLTFGDRA